MMIHKRVLIVDDDPTILHMLEHSLRRLGPEYDISSVTDSTEALAKVEERFFDLVVSDYMMPKITGVDLASAIRKVSPDTQVILMTAYGTRRLRDTTKILGVDAYLDKPFTLDEIHQVILDTVRLAHREEDVPDPTISSPGKLIREQMEVLQVNTSTRSVLLLDQQGNPVQVVGQVTKTEAASIGKFVAKNFKAAAELADTLGSQSIFKSSYHEGAEYNLYACAINAQFSLAVIFEARHKPGVVWFYTKQTAASLAELLAQAPSG
jgi:CheY-like chemotaxis protein